MNNETVTLSSDLIRIKNATDRIRVATSTANSSIEDVATSIEKVKKIKSVEEMDALQNINVGDICLVRDDTPLIPWSSGRTSNTFCFAKEVDVEDIKQVIIENEVVSYDISTIHDNHFVGYFTIDLNQNTAVFNITNHDTDNTLHVEYTYSNGKFTISTKEYNYNDGYKTLHDYSQGVVMINTPYSITPSGSYVSLDDQELYELLGRFVKTKEYKPFDGVDTCIYVPLRVAIDEPIIEDGIFTIDVSYDGGLTYNPAVNILLQPASETWSITVENTHIGSTEFIYYEYDSTTHEYIGSFNGDNISNVFSFPSGKIRISPASDFPLDVIQRLVDAGLIKSVSRSFPDLYIYDGSSWNKISQDVSPYEC